MQVENIIPEQSSTLNIEWHPDRDRVFAECHARPFKIIDSDSLVMQLAVLANAEQRKAQREMLSTWMAELDIREHHEEGSCLVYQTADLIVRYEEHLEFTTLTLTERHKSLDGITPFSKTVLRHLPNDWSKQFAGRVIAAFHLHIVFNPVEVMPKPHELKPLFANKLMIGSWPQQGAAQVWTHFHMDDEGFGRFLILNKSMTKGQMGRMVQRLIEIETYRLMALLGFVKARSITADLKSMDQQMAYLTEKLAHGSADDETSLLQELSDIAANIEAIRARTTFRFNASQAYHGVLTSRMDELDEDEVSGHLTIKEFLSRRLTPAVKSCIAVQERIENLSKRVNRASDMLRTRVELAIHKQNQHLLRSMDKRSRIQLAMQHTVEGLSVAAISYYSVGLVKYIIDAVVDSGVDFNKSLALGISVPFVIVGVWYVTRKISRKFKRLESKREE